MAASTVGSKTDVGAGDKFYWYSGIKAVTNSETDILVSTDVGSRDFLIKMQIAVEVDTSNNYRLTVYTGPADGSAADVELYTSDMTETMDVGRHGPTPPLEIIVPKDSAFRVTLQNVTDTTSRNWTITAHGEYLLK
jgi:hypothetical protein